VKVKYHCPNAHLGFEILAATG